MCERAKIIRGVLVFEWRVSWTLASNQLRRLTKSSSLSLSLSYNGHYIHIYRDEAAREQYEIIRAIQPEKRRHPPVREIYIVPYTYIHIYTEIYNNRSYNAHEQRVAHTQPSVARVDIIISRQTGALYIYLTSRVEHPHIGRLLLPRAQYPRNSQDDPPCIV